MGLAVRFQQAFGGVSRAVERRKRNMENRDEEANISNPEAARATERMEDEDGTMVFTLAVCPTVCRYSLFV